MVLNKCENSAREFIDSLLEIALTRHSGIRAENKTCPRSGWRQLAVLRVSENGQPKCTTSGNWPVMGSKNTSYDRHAASR